MSEFNGYAVYLYPKSLELLGETIKPYLQDVDGDAHVLCREIDTSGNFIELTLDGVDGAGNTVELELMLPTATARMIVSAHNEPAFGFGPRVAVEPISETPARPEPLSAQGDDKKPKKSVSRDSAKKK